MVKNSSDSWSTTIKPSRSVWSFNISEIWEYRDLIFLFVRRDLVSVYKQTILGPIWILLQPLLTSLIFTVIFGELAGFSTEGRPALLFYLPGVVIWTFFSETFLKTSNTFVLNASLFGKVYFPRMVLPLSVTIGNLISFFVQLVFFLIVYLYFYWESGTNFLTVNILFLPLLILIIAMLGLGLGIIISSLTTKYRDLRFLIGFGTQLLMYLSPVIYDLNSLNGRLGELIRLNPLSPIIQNFRSAFLKTSDWDWSGVAYSGGFALLFFLLGLVIFNRVEKNFLDTV